MKKITILLFVSTILFGTTSAQDKPSLVEKSYTDLGKAVDFKVSLQTTKDVNTGALEKKLILESKSGSNTVAFTKEEVSEVIAIMNTINTTFLSSKRTSNTEISYLTNKGFEVGCLYEVAVDKAATAAPITKKEKFYIETKDKYYEGKIVNVDQGGKYIWKDVVVTAAPAKEISGKWLPFIKMHNQTSQNTFSLSIEEFKTFVKYLEDNISKI